MLDAVIADLKNWAHLPYKEQGDLLDWILFIGLLTCATVLWTRIIRSILA